MAIVDRLRIALRTAGKTRVGPPGAVRCRTAMLKPTGMALRHRPRSGGEFFRYEIAGLHLCQPAAATGRNLAS